MTTKEIKYISHAKLQGIFEQLLEGIALIDAETLKITCCNPAFYKMFDYSLADVLQLNLPELHLEDDWTRVSTEYKQFLHEINYVAINTRFKRRDDTSFYADVTTTPLMVEERLYWLFVVRDSNQRDQEHKISCMLSDLKYRVLFENSSDALMLFKPPSWHFFEANQSALDLFGLPTLDAFIKLGPWDISPLHQPDGELSADKAQKMIKTAMQKGTHSFTWHHITTQNHTFYADVLLTKIELGDEAFLQASVRNITERYQLARLEAEMRVMSESEEKFRLISENAHDAIVMMDADKCISLSINTTTLNRLNVFINAKGGSGSSFIASNVAYILSREAQLRVALVDLDLQFGTIGLNFDQMPKYTLTQAVNAVDDLDVVSLEAYLLKYDDSLSLLLPSPTEILLPGELNISKLKKLLDLLKLNFNQIVIDLPRLIDPLSSLVMNQADQIVLVIQQNLAQYRDGRRLIQVLNKELDIPLEKIVIVINRYDPKNSLRVEDLKSLLNHNNVYTIVNDFERVESAANVGVPLCETSENSTIAHDLRVLAKVVGQVEFEAKKEGFFSFLGF